MTSSPLQAFLAKALKDYGKYLKEESARGTVNTIPQCLSGATEFAYFLLGKRPKNERLIDTLDDA